MSTGKATKQHAIDADILRTRWMTRRDSCCFESSRSVVIVLVVLPVRSWGCTWGCRVERVLWSRRWLGRWVDCRQGQGMARFRHGFSCSLMQVVAAPENPQRVNPCAHMQRLVNSCNQAGAPLRAPPAYGTQKPGETYLLTYTFSLMAAG